MSDPKPIDLQHLEWYARSGPIFRAFVGTIVAFGIACAPTLFGVCSTLYLCLQCA